MSEMLTLCLLVLIGFVFIVGLGILCVRRYEIAIFMVAISPAVPHFFISQGFGGGSAGETKGAYVRVGILLLTGCVGIIKYMRRPVHQRERLPFQFKLFFAFAMLALISTTFSVDPFYTFIRSVGLLSVFGFLLGLQSFLQDWSKLDRVFESLFIAVCVMAMGSLLALMVGAKTAWWVTEATRFRGVWAHPSSLGSFCMVAYPVLFWKYLRSQPLKKVFVCILIGSLLLLQLLTGSRGPFIGALIGISTWFWAMQKGAKLMAFLAVILVVGTMLLGMPSLLDNRFQREAQHGKSFDTLTGRTDIWKESFNIIKKRPLLGYGYDVTGAILEDSGNSTVAWVAQGRFSLHNGYVGTTLGLGLIGLSMWITISFAPFFRTFSLKPSVSKAFVIAVMSTCLAVNFVEYSVAVSGPSGIFFWIAWAIAGRRVPEPTESASRAREG